MNNTHEPKSKRRKLNADTITKPLPLPTELPAGDEEQTEAEPDAKVTDSTISDADYFASRLKRKLGDTLEQQPEEQEEALEDIKQDDAKQDDLTKSILQTGRLFVRNLAYHATADAISSHFSRFGSCTLHLPAEQDRASTGVAYVHYADAQDAINAHQTLDGKPFLGRLMHVLPSVDRFAPPQPAKFIADPKKKAKFQEEHGQKSSATLVTNVSGVLLSSPQKLT